MGSKSEAGKAGTREKLVWAVCALLVGIVCTTAFFLTRPTTQAETSAPKDPAPATEEYAEPDNDDDAVPEAASPADTRAILASWDQDSEAYQQLTAFVEDVCDPESPDYLVPAERVATFDMDGTFICEKAPIYIDQAFACWHVLEDPTYKAPKKLRRAVESVMDEVDAGIVPEDVSLNAILAQCYTGSTPDKLMDDVLRFASTTEVKGFSGMTYAESFYQPMVEVIAYLRANDFDVYVVSACERYVARALSMTYQGFAPDHVIASDLLVKASGQGDAAGLDYTFALDDELVIAGPEILETGKTNKCIAIVNEIGRRPVLSFGNSSGDFAMLNYATSNPQHQGLGFLVIADDTEREYGNEEKAASMREEVAAQGWVGISMRDDWTTIYGEGVERTSLPEEATLAEAA